MVPLWGQARGKELPSVLQLACVRQYKMVSKEKEKSPCVVVCVYLKGRTNLFGRVSVLVYPLHRNNVIFHIRPGSNNPAQDSSHLQEQ